MNGFKDERMMLEKFPLLIPCNFNRSWKGYILINVSLLLKNFFIFLLAQKVTYNHMCAQTFVAGWAKPMSN